MNTATRQRITQFHYQFQHELLPLLERDFGERLSPVLQRVVRTLELVQIERFVPCTRGWPGRPQRDRRALACAFVAKAVLGLSQTSDLIERLNVDKTLRRLCGFDLRDRRALSESLFSRAFAQFAKMQLPGRVHEALIRAQLGDALVCHLSRDATAIEVRERPVKPTTKSDPKPKTTAQGCLPLGKVTESSDPASSPQQSPAPAQYKPGRPKKGEVRPAKELTRLQRQVQGMSLQAMLEDLPRNCDKGCKRNSQGFTTAWRGYKLHLDVADGMIPVSAIVTSASLHDSQVALPLATMSAQRVTSLYDIMDSAYSSAIIREHSLQLGHVPIIDHNPAHGEHPGFAPHEAVRFRERSTVERVNGRLKDDFGVRRVNVRGAAKVTAHLMFAVLALSADQLLRWVT